MPAQDPRLLSPEEFERLVRQTLDQEGARLEEYESAHLETIPAPDGSYTFDVTARFAALGGDYLVVVECKRWSRPIERRLVQELEQKKQSVRANKAMLFSTSGYQRGALEFANAHRIALAVIHDGGTVFRARAYGREHPYQSWLPPYAAWLVHLDDEGRANYSSLGSFESPFGTNESQGYLLKFLREEPDEEPAALA